MVIVMNFVNTDIHSYIFIRGVRCGSVVQWVIWDGMVHIKESFLLIKKNSPCRFRL